MKTSEITPGAYSPGGYYFKHPLNTTLNLWYRTNIAMQASRQKMEQNVVEKRHMGKAEIRTIAIQWERKFAELAESQKSKKNKNAINHLKIDLCLDSRTTCRETCLLVLKKQKEKIHRRATTQKKFR